MTEKKGIARQLTDIHGMPLVDIGSMCIGTDKKGTLIYRGVKGTLWNLDGYDTFIPDGYVPVYVHKLEKWFYTKQDGPGDPFKQLGFIQDNTIPF